MEYLELNKNLKNLSSFRTDAISKYFFEIKKLEDIDKLKKIIIFAKENNIKYDFIGSGTNILFAFDKFDGIIIKNSLKNKDNIKLGCDEIEVFSGDIVISVTRQLLDKNITKFAPFLGLPGTFAGALVGNAGCFGLEMKDIFISAYVLDLETLEIIKIDKEFMNFEYRNSILKNNLKYFIISMKLDINSTNNDINLENSYVMLEKRKQTQPWGVFTCGSFFKNPVGDSAGRLIEMADLKGKSINGAKISEKHANFFINFNNANYKDIINLKNLAKEKVKLKFGIELEEEVKIIN